MTSQPSSHLLARLLAQLNPAQKDAVETIHGRLLVLAGAGSGKTKVLTLRMAHLVQHHQVHPKSILGLTFTNKAAEEMNHRLAVLIDPDSAKQVTLSTFHGFCMQVLRSDIERLGYTSQFTLYDEKDVQRLIVMIARDELGHESETMPSLAGTMQAINWAKNRGLVEEEISDPDSQWHQGFTRTVYRRLQDSLRAYNAVDFDNLLTLTLELFEKHPDILEKYQERFRYIMIDEYQDTNPVQYKIASLLAAKYGNLCVVGDDDQSIYGWRGAEVRNILDFNDARTIKLEQNYRSTNMILKAANSVIEKNTERHPKVLWSQNGDGAPIELFHAPKEENEAQAVAYRIVKLKESMGLMWKDIAILYRSNALSRPFEFALMRQPWNDGDKWVTGVPYQVFGGQEFYERREVKDLFAYMRVIHNPLDQEAILRIINQPRRGIGEATLDAITKRNRAEKVPLWDALIETLENEAYRSEIPSRALKGIEEFVDTIELAAQTFEHQPMDQALRWLVDKINYRKAIHEEVKSAQMRLFKWSNVEEFIASLAEQKSLQDFVQSTPLETNWNKKQQGLNENKVTLMTLHSAKGLEFKAVFLVGIEDHIIPHEKSMKQTGLEEERRLMYVAITRAKQYLTISMSRQRKRMGQDYPSQPSRFLFDIPKECLNLVSWA
jgi:DNA helicase-2/ATP-dependent DNA helicase PcrA